MSSENHSKVENASATWLDHISSDELVVFVSLYAFLLLAIVLGNGLVLLAFSVNERLRTTTNKVIMGLAVSDILVGFVSIPCWLYITITEQAKMPVNFFLYQFYIPFDIFIGSASILQLTALSIERCHAIVRPLRHRTLSVKVFYTMVLLPWLYAAIIASLWPVQYKRWKELYTLLMTATCFFIPFVIIIIAYLSIYRFARCQPIAKHRSERKAYQKDLRLAVTLAVITGLFVVAWLPLFVVSMIGTYYPQYLPPSQWTARVLQLVKFCHYTNSGLNPLVYACRNSMMIRTIRHIGHRLLCSKTQLPLPISHTSSYRISSRRLSSFSKSSERRISRKSSSVTTTSIRTTYGSKRSTGSLREGINVSGDQGIQQKAVAFTYSAV